MRTFVQTVAVGLVAAIGGGAAVYHFGLPQASISAPPATGSRTEELSCGSSTARTMVAEIMKKSPPKDLLKKAAPAHTDQWFAAEMKSDREYGERSNRCLTNLNGQINGWLSSAGLRGQSELHRDPGNEANVNDCRFPSAGAFAGQLSQACTEQRREWYASYRSCTNEALSSDTELNAARAQLASAYSSARYTLENIRTESINHDTGALVCVADLNIEVPNDSKVVAPIKFKQEITADRKTYLSLLNWLE